MEQKLKKENGEIKIVNTTRDDWNHVVKLFQKAMSLQGKKGYKVWEEIEEKGLQRDLENKLQYKLVRDKEILGVFSVQFSDPLIWRERDNDDAIYLHRIVVSPNHKGQRLFATVLDWAKRCALEKNLKYIRMDTWADNEKIIRYYQSFGFVFKGYYQTGNEPGLPLQNRNLEVALLEVRLMD